MIEEKIKGMNKSPQLNSDEIKLYCILKDISWLLRLIERTKKVDSDTLRGSGVLEKLIAIKLKEFLPDIKILEQTKNPEIHKFIKKVEFLWGIKP